MHRTATVIALLALAAATPAAQAGACAPPPSGDPYPTIARTDHQATGNRVVGGCGPLSGEVVDVELGSTPAWVLPDPGDRGSSWFVVLDDGSVGHVVAEAGVAPLVSRAQTPPLAAGQPPLAEAVGEEPSLVASAAGAADWFDDPLPGTRVTEAADGVRVALTGPTDRYRHGVLGDELEASSITLRDTSGGVMTVEIGEPDVVEGLSAMFVDLAPLVAGPELVVTVSNENVGARLAVYDLAGELVAESEPIGRGYRWLHQVGAGPIGPGGETEIVVVRTPHIGGIVEAYRLIGDRLVLVASLPGYSSHQLGSSNLDMALLADADGDDRLDVVVPVQDMTALGILTRTRDGFTGAGRLALDGVLATNLAASADADGKLALAVGTADGRLRIFR